MSRAGTFLAGLFAGLLWLEHRRPLRRKTESKVRRVTRNLSMATLSAAAVHWVEQPLIVAVSREAQRRGWGILRRMRLRPWAETALAVILMDYTLYLWHILAHRVPWLWRLHQVHHLDLDLDASTALRFHFAELIASVPWRAAQIAVIGVSPEALSLWQRLLLASILFHHSNVWLPERFERGLGLVLVTPRMHGIHHSIVVEQRDSNWSSGLSLWDRMHDTLRLDVPQEAITIGVEGHLNPQQVTLPRVLITPWEPLPLTQTLSQRERGSY